MPMASIEYRRNKHGKITSARVIWRDNGERIVEAFPDVDAAERWKKIIEAANGDTERAEAAVRRKLSDGPPFSEIADKHIQRLTDVTSGTRAKYRSQLKNYFDDFLAMPVDQIDEDLIADWIIDMSESGKAPKTIRNAHSLLNSVMRTAVERDHRADNPCIKSRLPKDNHTAETIMFLTQDEFSLLLSEIPEFYKPFVLFLVGTGLRFSEATALNKADFTDDRGKYSVNVQKAWKRGGDGTYTLGTPKTKRGRRTVGLHAELTEAVAPIVAGAKSGKPIFTTVRGGKLTSSAFYNRVWKDAIDRAEARGLRKRPRVHDLRHTFASWMLAEGMSISILSYLMGHESEATTRNVYTHVMPSVVHASADIAGQAMSSVFDTFKTQQLEPAESKYDEDIVAVAEIA